jgi:hypothetical protein
MSYLNNDPIQTPNMNNIATGQNRARKAGVQPASSDIIANTPHIINITAT